MKRIVVFLLAITSACLAYAQKPAAKQPAVVVTATAATVAETDSRETREELKNILRRYPPELGIVLKLDPTLFNNETYLATYPALAAFVAQHSEITHNPSFYLESVYVPGDRAPESPAVRMWNQTIEHIAIFSVFLMITLVFVWLIRTIIEQRRWSRLSRVQTEVHNKLLDRFASNEDLLAYMQTPAGKRFFESAPIPLDAGPRPVSAPIGRILWSTQAGLVIAAAGLGLQFVSGRVPVEVSQPLSAFGIVALCVGAGFVLSAIVSFALSRRLGLWESPLADRDSTVS
jgi:hypothetical protein